MINIKSVAAAAVVGGTVLSTAYAGPMPSMISPGGGSSYPEVRQLPPLPPPNADPAPYQRWIERYQQSPVKPTFNPPGLQYEHTF